jgi:hypothetical protein
MKVRSTRRTPYREMEIVRSAPNGRSEEARLGRALALSQLALLALCAARVGTDLLRGKWSIEGGGVALALLVVLALSLDAKAIARAIRDAARLEKHRSSSSSTPTTVGAEDAHNS